ncbi:phosphate ABC transporter substrate-binding protein [Clostridium fallax]|uniref:Phosphate-binding protein n=1 Tax=Clostridium fallax TaxID=1533 RepID=A0A1M4X6L8_9CLOT|nr:phosphate ABC transporter substrate-binding protein [Clostridium fallax]SHE89077.1 phosphate ABC transporter substrate-binding protein, PhoT family [Clostridium fallax]SQB07322.1 phosphate binding protein [Clostridium fallax]
MNKRNFSFFLGLILVFILSNQFISCSLSKKDDENKIVGAITLSGSTALQPLMERASEEFKKNNEDVSISVQGGGSGTGLTQVLQGAVDIGVSDIKAREKLGDNEAKNLKEHKVVVQGFAIVLSKDVNIKSLSKKDLKDIFSGSKTNWKEFGGDDKDIIVVHRPASSGTRITFTDKILDGDKELENDSTGIIQDSNGNLKSTLNTSSGAISYIGLAYLNDIEKENFKIISIDNIEPTKENIKEGKYPFWSFGYMYTKGQEEKITESFIDFIEKGENKNYVEEIGFIPLSEMKIK